jgi:hypothetical protein
MPQSTDLNRNPYYDDFSSSKNYYKVLFKPGVTVQARELSTLQSILQNQIEKFGSKFFSSGGVVIPGAVAFDSSYYAVEVASNFKGLNVEDYIDQILGKNIKGSTTGVTAKVVKILKRKESERDSTTLYVKYISSSPGNFTTEFFENAEELIIDQDINLGASFIFSGESFTSVLNPIERDATSVGSAASIEDGVYYVRGYFVDVQKDTILLDQYTNTPTYRVGLNISETIVDNNDDPDLNDNAQGFSNFAAPGADRFKITLSLAKKSVDDYNDDDFIELFRVENGIIRKIKADTKETFITDILAKRTFDESGNYSVTGYFVKSLESLNNRLGNNGIYLENQKTSAGSVPSDDLAVLRVSPGKSYVKGYEVDTLETIIDYPKPRTTKLVESSSSTFIAGNLLRVNNVNGLPNIGLTTTGVLTLHDGRLTNQVALGTTIGFARVYDYESHNTSYESPSSQFNLRLFDIQTFTNIVSTTGFGSSVLVGSYVEGTSTSASGYVKSVSGNTISLYQVSGSFIKSESLVIDGINSGNLIGTVTDYSVNDVKSLSSSNGFVCDALLGSANVIVGPFDVSVYSPTGIATITRSGGGAFANGLKIGDIISYDVSGQTVPVFTKINLISATKNTITVVGLSTVTNVCDGNVGVGTYVLQNITLRKPQLVAQDDSSLYSKLKDSNISSVNLLNSSVYVKNQYSSLVKSGTTLTLPSLVGTDYVYSGFDEERYTVVNADNSVENLTNSTFTITNGGKDAQFTNLSATAGPCRVITTQIKSNVTSKKKKLNRCTSISIEKTKYSTPKNAGLGYTSVYGVRVEDNQISLNVPDVIEIQAVYESSNTANPEVPWIAITGINSPTSTTTDLIIGELVVGETSGAVAVYCEERNSSQIYLIYKSAQTFQVGEEVSFKESGFSAFVGTVETGDKNILNEFILDNGQRKHYYDYGRLVRKTNSREPFGKLKVFFDYLSFETNDSGDLITSSSYPSFLYGKKIPVYGGVRNTDTIDIRPRVGSYSLVSKLSPFDFASRSFATEGANASQILASDENVVFDYEFYLGRIDKLTLSREGDFNIVFGEPSETPVTPQASNEVLEVATIISGPYVYDLNAGNEVTIVLKDNRRFTMSDLRDVELRVRGLEYYTALSLLESSTQNLLVEDENGLNRFKSGFFVDNFSNYSSADTQNPDYRANISEETLSANRQENRIDLSLFPNDTEYSFQNVDITTTPSNNIKRTGTILSLDYTELKYIEQPFASRIVSVNPYNISTWIGNLTLRPAYDHWQVYVQQDNWIPNWNRRGQINTFVSFTRIPFMRARNIQFTATRLKPSTRFDFVFGGLNLNNAPTSIFPKLVEINNVNGTFLVGETVRITNGVDTCVCRICAPNHKTGPIDNPEFRYNLNPYLPTVGISTLYGPQSTFLNIDIETLNQPFPSQYWGNIKKGSTVYGLTSKATANVADLRLVTDTNGTLQGSVWIPPNSINSGSVTARLQTTRAPIGVPGETTSSAETSYFTAGTLITTVRNIFYDPLAQTFVVDDETGIIPTSVDVYFANKDESVPVTLQIRETVNGYPGGSNNIVGGVTGLEKVLLPDQVNTSNNGTVATTFTFDTLVRLEGGREYAIVLLSDSDVYTVWHSRMGETEITTANNPDIGKIVINKQPSMGTLFKSQNGATWVPSPDDDLKFIIKRANFSVANATARFYNAKIDTRTQESILPNNPIVAFSTAANSPINDGRHILVFQPNHGLHSPGNKVQIVGVESDILPTKLTVAYGITETGSIGVGNTSIFGIFDGSVVSATNPGYIKINDEIIRYQGVSPGQLIDITRSQFGTVSLPHALDSLVYKYEFNGVPLSKINTTHTIVSSPKPTLDEYYVQVSAGSTFTDIKTGGGSQVYASKNQQFNRLSLNEVFFNTFNRTSISGRIRTVSSTSIDGTETSYIDQGFETIDVNGNNTFNNIRMVASKENENEFLNPTEFIGSKSFTLEFSLETQDSRVSPIIDLEQTYVTTDFIRINNPIGISSYASDSRVNANIEDPHSFIHISNRVDLQESANSLKVLCSSIRDANSDFRVLYKIYRNDVPDEDQVWELFPGYLNLDVNGIVLDSDDNDGRPDRNVPVSLNGEYRDYSFTVDDLPPFTGFQIKIVGSSTSQASTPVIKDLRVIALK